MQEEQLYTECGQDERTSIYQSYCVFSLLFWKKISTTQDIASTEISYQFLAQTVPLLIWGEIKPPAPVNQPIHFQLQGKPSIMHQSIPAAPSPTPPPPPPRATAGHLLALLVPGVGHLQILGCPGAGHLPTTGRTLSFWHACGFLSEYNYTKDFIGKTSRLAHLSRTGKNWRTL